MTNRILSLSFTLLIVWETTWIIQKCQQHYKDKNQTKEVRPVNFINYNQELNKVSELSGLNQDQKRVLWEISNQLITEPRGSVDKLVSLSKTVKKFSEEIQNDSINNHGFTTSVDFEESKVWSKVAKELNEYKYQ